MNRWRATRTIHGLRTDIETGSGCGQDISALVLAIFHDPVNDRAAALQQYIVNAITGVITGTDHGKSGCGRGNVLAILQNPVDDGAA